MRKTVILFLLLSLASLVAGAPKVAVLNPTLDKDIDEKVGQIIVDKILEELLKSKNFNILDRASRDVIWQERNFQITSGEIDTAQIKEIGKGLGADYIVTVKLVRVGSLYAMTAQLIDVQTLEVINAASDEAPGDLENAISLARSCGAQLAGVQSSKGGKPTKKPIAVKTPTPTKATEKASAQVFLFDSRSPSLKIPIGDTWLYISDVNSGGNSSASIDEAKLASGILRFDYRIGSKVEFPYAILAASLGKAMDLSKYTAIEVKYRGKGKYYVEICADQVKDYRWHSTPLPQASEEWRTARLALRSFAQPEWADVKVPLSLARIHDIQFSALVETKAEKGWLEISSMKLVE
jgi:TolB-like protein